MKYFDLATVDDTRRSAGKLYLEFLKSAALSCGLYNLAAGAEDTQQPHTEDEIYFVLSGSGQIQAGSSNQSLQSGAIIYIPANEPHHFHSITADLSLLVVFAPAEYSQREA